MVPSSTLQQLHVSKAIPLNCNVAITVLEPMVLSPISRVNITPLHASEMDPQADLDVLEVDDDPQNARTAEDDAFVVTTPAPTSG